MIKISEIKLPLDSDEKELRTAAAKALRCKEERITSLRIAKKAVDSRKRITYSLSTTSMPRSIPTRRL